MSRARTNHPQRRRPAGAELRVKVASWLVLLGLLVWLGFVGANRNQVPPPDGEWTANAELSESRAITDQSLGAVQGVVVRDGKVYAYGDVFSAKPRVGVMREYDLELKPTGRVVWLRRDEKPLILHPTGLTWDQRLGTFLGDTVLKKAVIYRLDWARAWQDGNLDHAVRDVIDDDAATNGCRPTFVSVAGRDLSGDLGLRRYPPRDPSPGPGSVARGQAHQLPRRDRPPLPLRAVQPEHAVGWPVGALDLRAKRD